MLVHDIEKEKDFNYAGLDEIVKIKHLAKFISGLWQIHCFAEGNTRTIAVFAIQYLRSFGYEITNKTFERHSWYFRNALVRANYKNVKLNISETIEPLIKFPIVFSGLRIILKLPILYFLEIYCLVKITS